MRYVADNLIEELDGQIRLVAGRDRKTGKLVFPFPEGTEAASFDRHLLSPIGTLWSWTVQRFRPKDPFNGAGDDADFRPYAVGYVELPNELIVEARLLVDDFAQLGLHLPMRLILDVYRHDQNGEPVSTYAFTPDLQAVVDTRILPKTA